MRDYSNDENTKIFLEALNSLNIRFPVAELSKKLNYNKGNISSFMHGKKPISDDFLKSFLDFYNLNKEDFTTHAPEGRVVKDDDYFREKMYIIPVKGRGGLENAMYDPICFKDLKVENTMVKKQSSNGSVYFKIEVDGVSMDDGSKHSLAEGDWAYCRSISRECWKSKFHYDKYDIFCFFHNKRGIIFKKIKDQNVEAGELLLCSLHPDKKRFPDFTISIYECSYICNVTRIVTDL